MADASQVRKRERRKRRDELERWRQQRKAQSRIRTSATPTPPENDKNKQDKKIQEKDIQGLKFFDKLVPLLKPLHETNTARDSAGNRNLYFDQYTLLVLLYLFNPIVSSLRALEQASELKKVQKQLGVKRTSLGSLSEAASSVFDGELLKPIIAQLGSQLEPLAKDPRLQDIEHTLTLVDGSLINALPAMAEASFLHHTTGKGLVKWRLHTHFEVERFVPERISVTRNGGGEQDERAVMQKNVESDRCYVMDRGFAKFALFNQINTAHSSYVCRIRDNSHYEVIEERELSEAAREARVTQDVTVRMGETGKAEARPDHDIRLVVIKIKPHTKTGKYKGGSTGPGSDGYLRIATNLLDVPAEIIALLYEYRWTIEIFFRFFKQILGCRHLISHSENGITIQTYCAIIACMLMCLWTGRKPTKRTYEMICYYFIGLASEAELLAHIEKLKRADEEKRKRAAQ